MLAKLLREPLLHFMVLGAAAFLLHAALVGSTGTDGRTIVVDHGALVTFLRHRTPQLDAATAAAAVTALSAEDREALVREYVRAEALYREALALGLDRGDYSVRRRLVQQMEHLLRSMAEDGDVIDAEAVAAFHAAHRNAYREPARMTFAHVFVAIAAGQTDEQAYRRAVRVRDHLQARRVAFHEAPEFGDRFPYGVNFVGQTLEEVAASFGDEVPSRLFALEPDPARWQGPLRSVHGWHLVLITERRAEHDPPLDAVREQVEFDARRSLQEQRVEETVGQVVARYRLTVDRALAPAR